MELVNPDKAAANAAKVLEHFRKNIIKHFANSFLKTELESKLKEKGITKVVVEDLGYETTLIEDACATRELSYQDQVFPAEQVHFAFVGALNGMYCAVTSTEDFLQQEADKS
ncbi:hypothetical protein ACQP3R_07520 [Bacillus inaquosorum]|uniref:hypothetical protein n=1 Tax=Bacillus inaquosorum TaxID=483913 RepID=UPI003D03ACAE